jgi:hypothetical protein
MEQELLELERGFWAVTGDADVYRARFAEDGICVFGFGMLDKQATVAAMDAAEPWATVELADVTVVPLAPQAAALVYTATAQRTSGAPYEANVTSVYAHRDGMWQLVVHQQTPGAPTS